MNIRPISTGTVKITTRWQHGEGSYFSRITAMLLDRTFTEPLPIWCWLIEHPTGPIVVDAGISANANDRVWFPPFMPLVQRAAPFQITGPEEEIGPQLQTLGVDPADVRTVILTHLHQDHEGGLHHFPNAEFVVSAAEWKVAQGLAGRMVGYLNFRWPADFSPTPITFETPDPYFAGRYPVTDDGSVYLVPTPGHTVGHLSVVVQSGDVAIFIAGDAAYTQDLLLADALDGVTQDADAKRDSHRRILAMARTEQVIFLPSHEWASRDRLSAREVLAVE